MVPGSGYRAQYKGYAVNLEGENRLCCSRISAGFGADGYRFKRECMNRSCCQFCTNPCDKWTGHLRGITPREKAITEQPVVMVLVQTKKIVDDAQQCRVALFTDAHLLAQFG